MILETESCMSEMKKRNLYFLLFGIFVVGNYFSTRNVSLFSSINILYTISWCYVYKLLISVWCELVLRQMILSSYFLYFNLFSVFVSFICVTFQISVSVLISRALWSWPSMMTTSPLIPKILMHPSLSVQLYDPWRTQMIC